MRAGRCGQGGKGKPAVTAKQKEAWGIDTLTENEEHCIAGGDSVTDEQLNRIYGLRHPVRHPSRTSGEDAKGGGQKWNPNCFMGLGWKGEKDRKRGRAKEEPGFESVLLRPKRAPHGGLKNHGATCYLNSMLQCLFFNIPFRKGIMQLTSEGSNGLPDEVRSSEGFKPIIELRNIFSHLHVSKARSYDPRAFIEGLKLSTTVQQDAQEFLKMYLTYIETELSKHESIPAELRSLVKSNFSGKYAYCTTCKECNVKSPIEVPFYDLDLKVQGISQIEESLDDFFKEDELVGDNKYQCSTCDKKTEARRGIELLGLPTVLNLQLLRFVYDVNSNSRKKVSSTINFPKVLDLSKWLKRGQGAAGGAGAKRRKKSSDGRSGAESPALVQGEFYELEAVVLHTGASAVQGHYIAHVKHPVTEHWLRFDDEHVSSLQDDEYFGNAEALAKARKKRKDKEQNEMEGRVKSRDAYMLIYRRQAQQPAPSSGALSEAEEECRRMIPSELCKEIEQDSLEREEQAKTAEETSRCETACRETALEAKEDIWAKLPDDKHDGYWVGTDWLKHWVSVEPGEKCDKIDIGPITSKYGRADPRRVNEMKIISAEAFRELKDKYGIAEGSTMLRRSDLCCKTIQEECSGRAKQKETKDTLYTLKRLLAHMPHVSDVGAVWLSKQWCKERVNGGNKVHEDPEGEQVFCCQQVAHGNGEETEAPCSPRGLNPDKTKRRLVSAELVRFLEKSWPENDPKPKMIPAHHEACPRCTERAEDRERSAANLRQERNLVKTTHEAAMKDRPIKLKSGQSYYLVDYEWVQHFRDFVEVPEAVQTCERVTNRPLLVEGGDELAVDPGDITRVPEPKYLWLEEADWKKLKDEFGSEETVEVKVVPLFKEDGDGLRSVTVNRPPPKSAQAATQPVYIECSCSPQVCKPYVQQQREKLREQSLNFVDAVIKVTRQYASASAQQVGANGLAVDPAPALSSPSASRSGRLRKGDVYVTVSSSSSIKSVKLQIYEKLHFSPSEQKLMYGQQEMAEGDKTLFDYQVPRGAVLVLHILSAVGSEEELLAVGKRQREIDAGFSGTLLSGFTTEKYARAEDGAVLVSSMAETGVQHIPAAGKQDAASTTCLPLQVQPTMAFTAASTPEHIVDESESSQSVPQQPQIEADKPIVQQGITQGKKGRRVGGRPAVCPKGKDCPFGANKLRCACAGRIIRKVHLLWQLRPST